MKRKTIQSDIGFSDGEIESYRKVDDVVEVVVKAWNEQRISVTFCSVVRMLDNDSGTIENLFEFLETTEFLQAAIDRVYDVAPSEIPYRHFQFVGVDGEGSLDVVAEQVSIAVDGVVANLLNDEKKTRENWGEKGDTAH